MCGDGRKTKAWPHAGAIGDPRRIVVPTARQGQAIVPRALARRQDRTAANRQENWTAVLVNGRAGFGWATRHRGSTIAKGDHAQIN
jgi:hypothetical protein